ncbi:MAG: hypothetical protein UX65_C0014G0009 [Parcubacteria group bacterium GW2011_GWB1_46_8]|nr:MAG: hypothetical protein UX14_C0017G0011 [Parcubacteria group bacterium GW2011_GWF1_45_5]KKU10660.1 MAG: hypothetical protein UX15_C0024G0006 [Parcubacteria group bacterium GW2011_GWA1_45_7]KKU43236.1 MAG: hypothetical protein UX61_C0026G0010 [Parcubacteria group bacterium GW2011_GWA2_46_7]KKU45942.1 MAG: hypothetical protein UX65_C0014G0009 [Parcubacteria group bacterium GW2011_GWB1_46_8]
MDKKVLYIVLAVAAVLNLSGWLLLYFGIPEANFPFIIKYTIGSPSDFWGTRFDLFLVPLLGLIILFVNGIVGYSIYSKHQGLSVIMAGVAAYTGFLGLLYAFATVYVNTY